MKYFGDWSTYQEMIADWGTIVNQPIPSEDEVLFASYGTENYEGDALVLFTHEGKLYEVNGSHCSCHGLSEESYSGGASQWEPEETSWEALKIRKLYEDQHKPEAIAAFDALRTSSVI